MAAATSSLSASQASQPIDFYSKLVELQQRIDNLNIKIEEGETPQFLDAKITKVTKQAEEIRLAHEAELESVKTWGMSPKTWKWIGGGCTLVGVLAELANIGSNIGVTIIVDNTTTPIIIATTTSAGIALIATGLFGVFTYGQTKLDRRMTVVQNKIEDHARIATFLSSYQEFIQKPPQQHTSAEEKKQFDEMKACIEVLKNIPLQSMPQDTKDKWMCSLIEALPDDNSTKKRLIEQKNLAIAIHLRKTTAQQSRQQDCTITNKLVLKISDSSDKSTFLRTSNADKASEESFQKFSVDDLETQYQKNMDDFRREFGMEINELSTCGYIFDSKFNLKKIKKSQLEIKIKV